MNFRPELAEAVVSGRKTVTRRAVSENPNSPYHPLRAEALVGKRIAICPGRGKHRIGEATVTAVSRARFDPFWISDNEARREGFAGASSFVAAWKEMHGHLPIEVWRIELDDPMSVPRGGENE